jgi:hypothetical protein
VQDVKNATIREFYPVLRAAFKLAKVIGHFELGVSSGIP